MRDVALWRQCFSASRSAFNQQGKRSSLEHAVRPDITVLGKALGGGIVPIAATIVDARLNVAPEMALGHYTHEKSPVGAAAALATLDVIAEENLVERARTLGEYGHLTVIAIPA